MHSMSAERLPRMQPAIAAHVLRAVATGLAILIAACSAPPSTATGVAPGRPAPEIYSTGHVMKYAVSLPAGWSRNRAWPVVVVIPDATRDFAGNLAQFATAGASSPFIFVAPHVVTSGGAHGYREAPGFRYSEADWSEVDRLGDFRFDEDGLAAVVADVHARFHGDERVYLTGWEAGGHTVWALLFRHPERYRAVAPVTPNYLGRWLDPPTPPSTGAKPPVKVLFCGSEGVPPSARQTLLTQTREAIAAAQARGFGEIRIEVREGARHGPLASDVLAWFASLSAEAR